MIIMNEKESLRMLGTKNVALEKLAEKADVMEQKWKDFNTTMFLRLTPDGSVEFTGTEDGMFNAPEVTRKANITEHAFGQICNTVGVPAGYMMKCLGQHQEDLAIQNYDTWASLQAPKPQIIRTYDGAVHAQVTSRYNVFDHSDVMHGILDAMDDPKVKGRYEANQAFLSPDKLHIRFVDFDHPLHTAGDTLNTGFTINSNNVGSGAFSIRYFIYRFACTNGIVKVQNGGMLFRQTHLNSFREIGPQLFRDIIFKAKDLDEMTAKQIEAAATHKFDDVALEQALAKAQKDLHFGKAGKEKVLELIDSTYDRTQWGLINAVTETAQDYTLDTRLEMEEWSGRQLTLAGRMAA